MPTFESPVRVAVGGADKKLRDGFGIVTLGDLLRHFPRRYVERGEITELKNLAVGEHVTVQARVRTASSRPMRQRRGHICLIVVEDDRGHELSLTFFGKSSQEWRVRQLPPGTVALFAGKVDSYRGKAQLTHPDYSVLDSDEVDDLSTPSEAAEEYADALIPVYPATKDLASWNIARAMKAALAVIDFIDDPLPSQVRAAHQLLDQETAYRFIHFPKSYAEVTKAKQRFKWDEAFVLQAAFAQRRIEARRVPARPRPGVDDGILAAFDARLPFTLTDGQREVGAVLDADLVSEHPMHRLLQGEVGSGKTVVALRAMLRVVDSGGQAALLAPTEVLAQQHQRSITELLGPLAEAGLLGGGDVATRVALITGSQGAAARREALLDAASGAAGIVIGTHALLEEHVQFADLGLVVVDEQHRFGVEQREALRAKGAEPPHVLVMTATPIPRTVAISVYGDLEMSTLTELPAGRPEIQTTVIPAQEKPEWLDRAWERVREEVAKGHQVFVVCPRIGEGPADDDADAPDLDESGGPLRPASAVLEVHPMLVEGPLVGLRVGLLHGRLPADDKDAVMRAFAAGDLDVLVATTVIEVGVDVPNATGMVVLDADRFGVSQLHQLRGRVGRGVAPGLCLLVTDSPAESPSRERLDAVAATTDGFALSELDLEQRREGDVLGATQAGRRRTLRMLSVLHDAELIRTAREAATEVVESDPELAENGALAAAIAEMLEPEQADYLEKA